MAEDKAGFVRDLSASIDLADGERWRAYLPMAYYKNGAVETVILGGSGCVVDVTGDSIPAIMLDVAKELLK